MKDASRRSKRIVGGFIVATLVFLCGTIFFMGGDFAFLRGSTNYFAKFSDIGGLSVGAPIKVGGVVIGSVDQIHLENNGGKPQIIARLAILHPYNDLVRVDSQVSTETQGMLGDKFVDIAFGEPNSERAPPETFLKTKEHTELSEVVSKSTDIIDSINTLTKRVENFTQGLPDTKVMTKISKSIADSTSSLAALTNHLNSENSAIKSLGDKQMGQDIKLILENLKATTASLASTAKKIDQGQGTLGALVNDASLYNDIKSLLGRANRSKTLKYVIQKSINDDEER